MKGGRSALRLAGTLVVLAGACAPKLKTVDFSETPHEYRSKDYEDAYDRWTRYGRVLHEVDFALEAWATFKSWDFREAYVERYVQIYSLSDADRATLRRAQLDALHHAYEFHVTAQSANYKWNDLEKSSSAWRVTLIDALGHELAPDPIKLEKLPDAYERQFFPNRTPFTKTYGIRFPVPADDAEFRGVKSGTITLRFASPIGRLDLTWQSGPQP